MTNQEIIATESMLVGYEYNGDNLKTFQEWKKAGYTVKKGEKAFIKVGLWKPVEKKVKDKDGKEKKEKSFILKTSFLFTPAQVEKLDQNKIKNNKAS